MTTNHRQESGKGQKAEEMKSESAGWSSMDQDKETECLQYTGLITSEEPLRAQVMRWENHTGTGCEEEAEQSGSV